MFRVFSDIAGAAFNVTGTFLSHLVDRLASFFKELITSFSTLSKSNTADPSRVNTSMSAFNALFSLLLHNPTEAIWLFLV
jgi:hypothetical protein